MSLLFLVRHGQASFLEQNYDKLSAVGEAQARLLGEYWAERKVVFDRVFTGPRVRQRETARIAGEVCTQKGLPWPEPIVMREFDEYSGEAVMDQALPGLVETDSKIRELSLAFRNAGSLREQHSTFQRLFEAVISKWVAGELKVENIESWPEFSARVQRGLVQISSNGGGGERVAVFSSAGPIGVGVQYALELAPTVTLKLVWMVRNCSLNEFLFSRERFTMSTFNAAPHLDDPSMLTYR
ncbi:MAG TPA: histidine phosphatase family protein [Candidatus Angelobacter sp.]|nr:histidine phosphatase family protein [Candidatus Angelobacter sp.]